jgi:CHAT domain-containing protein/Flp pilus assembly protein TadD
MQKTLLSSFLLAGLIVFCFSQDRQRPQGDTLVPAYQSAQQLYLQAGRQLLQAGDNELLLAGADETYQKALSAFLHLLPYAQQAGDDSLALLIQLRTGFIHYYFDSTEAAKKDYLAAAALKEKLPAVPDTVLFTPSMYTGGIYYSQNQFDSALYWYKRAEEINDRSAKPLAESQRLYNRLGALFYETGNYRQARNYFEKAIALTDPGNTDLLTNYRINMAALLVKLDETEAAKKMYESLLPSPGFENEIYHNLGIIHIKQEDYKKAIDYLRKVSYTGNKKDIDLYYNFGVAYAELDKNDSAEFYLQRAIAENVKWNGQRKNTQYGLILKYQADELAKQQLYKEATAQYQQAVIQFHNEFRETDPYRNPVLFTGVFSYINLFNTLAAKAAAFENWYRQEKNITLLTSSLETYQSAFKLADYVERTYDSDEARLFLSGIKYTVHSKPINVCLQLYDLTQKRNYLEEAYLFDQRNKASILALNVQENELRNKSGQTNQLIIRETALKSLITRLSLKAGQVTDSTKLYEINGQIRDHEIELGKLQEKLNNDPAWLEKRLAGQIPSVNQLQKQFDNATALLSFHLSDNELLTLFITPSRFEYHKSVVNKNFFLAIDSFKAALHNTSADQRFNAVNASVSLYKKLITPLLSKLPQTKRLIIIPDDELNYLPFEALQDENKKYLVELFSVQYQYSTALLKEDKKIHNNPGTLSFAPFTAYGYVDSSGNAYSSLPSSIEEIAELEGKIFTDSTATKKNFLRTINHYEMIHLATHAQVNNEDPGLSFIAFYPEQEDHKLYTREIADLKLDSTQLIILSACETGAGKLVKGEGLMSLSRAFAYAGCPNIITSLWKAEDKTTAFLTRQLHYYLNKHYSKDKALQMAKLDLLKSEDIDPRLKSPNYWAQLILIGDYEARHNSSNWWWIAIGIIVIAIGYKLLNKKKD